MIPLPTDERGASPMFTRRFLITGVAASAAAVAVTGIPSAPASEAAKRWLAEFYVSLGRVPMPSRYAIIREVWKLRLQELPAPSPCTVIGVPACTASRF
jgi:hypothetical protein